MPASADGFGALVSAIEDDATPLVRADFTHDAAWQKVVDEVTRPVDFEDPEAEAGEDGYAPYVAQVGDRYFDGATPASVAAAWDRNRDVAGYVLLADERSMREAASGGEITLVYLDLTPTPEDEAEFGWKYGRSFRVVTSEIASIESNLSIANMDFDEFADEVDGDGVFRGFDE